MRTATLQRITRPGDDDEGVFGELVTDADFRCMTLELPRRDNARGKSCIPPGVYKVDWRLSPSHGECFHVDGVAGRSDILIHSANLAGDKEKGYVAQLEGCIAPGVTIGTFRKGSKPAGDKDQRGVTASTTALKALQQEFAHGPFELTIKEVA